MIRFNSVSLRYGRGQPVLRDVSFNLPPRSFHFLTGASGAGKTSLLRLMYLGIKPSRGQLYVFEREVSSIKRHDLPALKRRIGVVFQDFRLIEHLTALENVMLPLRLGTQNLANNLGNNLGAEEQKIREHASELLRWVGLGNALAAHPSELSGGQQQRVAIARAVINRPDLLLADEPTGNVDDAIGLRLLHLFIELNKLGTTVVVATHNQQLLERFAKPRLILADGRLTIEKPPEEVPEQMAGEA